MIDQIEKITETEWGLHVVLKKDLIINDKNLIPIIEHIIPIGKKAKKKHILFDATQAYRSTSFSKTFEIVERIKEAGSGGVKIAIVIPNFADKEYSKFIEAFSRRSGVLIRYFPDTLTAGEWLLE